MLLQEMCWMNLETFESFILSLAENIYFNHVQFTCTLFILAKTKL